MDQSPQLMIADLQGSSSVNMQQLCRLCGSKTEEYSRLSILDSSSLNLQYKIITCLDITISETDLLPKFICISCADNLDHFSKFKESCKSMDNLMSRLCDPLLVNDAEPANFVETVLNNELPSRWNVRCDSNSVHTEKTLMNPNSFKASNRRIAVAAGQSLLKSNNVESNKNMITTIDVCMGRSAKYLLPSETILPVDNKFLNEDKLIGVDISEVDVKRLYQCDFCLKTLTSKKCVNAHIALKHSGRQAGQKHECTICNKKYKTKTILKNHIKIYHEKKFALVCDHCGKGCSDKTQLQNHVRSQHTHERPFACTKCDKTFISKCYLQKHMKTTVHNDIIKWKCDICNKEYASQRNLIDHKKIHEIPLKDRQNYHCSMCNKRYQAKKMLKIHMRSHTGEKPYECKSCSNTYASQGGLRIHTLTHTGERNHVCEICGSAFALPSSLKVHRITVHEGLKMFKCNDCDKSYTQNSSLNIHLKKTGHTKTRKDFK